MENRLRGPLRKGGRSTARATSKSSCGRPVLRESLRESAGMPLTTTTRLWMPGSATLLVLSLAIHRRGRRPLVPPARPLRRQPKSQRRVHRRLLCMFVLNLGPAAPGRPRPNLLRLPLPHARPAMRPSTRLRPRVHLPRGEPPLPPKWGRRGRTRVHPRSSPSGHCVMLLLLVKPLLCTGAPRPPAEARPCLWSPPLFGNCGPSETCKLQEIQTRASPRHRLE
jgi:hypothetical protein